MGACRERVERRGAAAGDAVCGVIRWWSGRGGAGAGRAGGGADSIGAGDVLDVAGGGRGVETGGGGEVPVPIADPEPDEGLSRGDTGHSASAVGELTGKGTRAPVSPAQTAQNMQEHDRTDIRSCL